MNNETNLKTTTMILSAATHPKFKNWETTIIQIDSPVLLTEKAVQLKGEIVKGSVWFPLSCVNVHNKFEVEVPCWMLSKKGLNFLA